MSVSWVRKKSIEAVMSELAPNKVELKRCLSTVELISLGLGAAVGSGIFVLAGTAGRDHAGPALFISFMISAFACVLSGLAYAEFASCVPVAGSAYTYTYVALGEVFAFLIGWDLTLEYAIASAAVAQGWASYIGSFCKVFDLELPEYLTGKKYNDIFGLNLLSPVVVLFCGILLVVGIKESATFNFWMAVLNVVMILFFVVAGCFFVDSDNYTKPCDNTRWSTCPSDAENSFFPYGSNGVFEASAMVFFAYIGFDTVTALAEETENPEVALPRGVIGTLAISCLLYVAVSVVLMGMIPFQSLDVDAPLAEAFHQYDKTWIQGIVTFGALTNTTCTVFSGLISQPRVFYRMARDGLFFEIFGYVSPDSQTPVYGTIFTCILACTISIFFNFDALASMISVGTLMAFMLVNCGVITRRYQSDNPGYLQGARLPLALLFYCSFGLLLGFSFEYDWGTPAIAIFASLVVMMHISIVAALWGAEEQNSPVFRCPYVPNLPLAGCLANSFLIASLEWKSFTRVFLWGILGFLIYLGYGRHHSKLNLEDPELLTNPEKATTERLTENIEMAEEQNWDSIHGDECP